MIRGFLRLIGFAAISAGFVALVIDGTRTIAGGKLSYTVLGETWRAIHFDSLQLAQPAIERYVAVWLWDPVILTLLLTPTAIVCLVAGFLFLVLGRKREPQIGVIGRR